MHLFFIRESVHSAPTSRTFTNSHACLLTLCTVCFLVSSKTAQWWRHLWTRTRIGRRNRGTEAVQWVFHFSPSAAEIRILPSSEKSVHHVTVWRVWALCEIANERFFSVNLSSFASWQAVICQLHVKASLCLRWFQPDRHSYEEGGLGKLYTGKHPLLNQVLCELRLRRSLS